MATVTAANYGVKYSGGGFWATHREADSQTFKRGQLVYLSGGYVTECASDAVLFTGIAGADATNVLAAWTDIPVFHIADDTEIYLCVINNVTAAAGMETHKGAFYGLTTATNINYLDYSEVTAKPFHVIDKWEFDAWTDTGCRYVVKIQPTMLTG
jgi:hypothetical protein